ncbi:hypothetical protein AVEN_52730-1 [Araneus ventricosus]|uniref:Uncharacterized protein n=1 Tax=Araneus ventricosus TaxID=182803 RepID=A0A4Y2IIH7_ARAVE|nr:hypothetical protein AVEN_52730-1 [Araneus ventricosus]
MSVTSCAILEVLQWAFVLKMRLLHKDCGDYFNDNDYSVPISDSMGPLTLEDVDLVSKNLKGGKTPGLDKIDYKMWTQIFNLDKLILTDLLNCCFKFSYFQIF